MHDNLIPGQEYVVVTGGAKGIGQNIVEHLVKEGLNVISISRSHKGNTETIKNLITVPCDLSNFEKTEEVFKAIESKNIKISGLVNNAGYSEWRSIERIDEKICRYDVTKKFIYLHIYNKVCPKVLSRN